jgi:hypothetical protein
MERSDDRPSATPEELRRVAQLWGKRGAAARVASLSPERRQAIARRAALARWAAWRAAGQPPLRPRPRMGEGRGR